MRLASIRRALCNLVASRLLTTPAPAMCLAAVCRPLCTVVASRLLASIAAAMRYAAISSALSTSVATRLLTAPATVRLAKDCSPHHALYASRLATKFNAVMIRCVLRAFFNIRIGAKLFPPPGY